MNDFGKTVRTAMMAAATLALFATISLAQQASPAQSAAMEPVKAAPTAAHPAARMQAEEERSAPNSPASQGIKVHGHWKIDIKNPNGSLDRTVEFENSLAPGEMAGAYLLSQVLTGGSEIGDWGIAFVDSANSWCPNYCLIDEVAGQGALGSVASTLNATLYSGLTVKFVKATVANKTVVPPTIVLQGSATAATDTTINNVQTMAGICVINPTASTKANATACATGTDLSMFTTTSPTSFTTVNLNPAITVVSGQIVQFTVTISFS
jgi:hypothetical protein